MRNIAKVFINHNPRNLELLRLQRKPSGYSLEKDHEVRNYFFRAEFYTTKRHLEAQLVHPTAGVILQASTKERELNYHLTSLIDSNAIRNLAKLIAYRCAKCGIYSCTPYMTMADGKPHLKQVQFFQALEQYGVKLQEPATIRQSFINDPHYTYDQFLVRHTKEDKLDEKMTELDKIKKLY